MTAREKLREYSDRIRKSYERGVSSNRSPFFMGVSTGFFACGSLLGFAEGNYIAGSASLVASLVAGKMGYDVDRKNRDLIFKGGNELSDRV